MPTSRTEYWIVILSFTRGGFDVLEHLFPTSTDATLAAKQRLSEMGFDKEQKALPFDCVVPDKCYRSTIENSTVLNAVFIDRLTTTT